MGTRSSQSAIIMNRLVPELYVSDLQASLDFYVDTLGFVIEYERPEEQFVALHLGEVRLMLEETSSLEAATDEEWQLGQWRPAPMERPFGRGMNLEIRVDDVEMIAERIIASGRPVRLPLHERNYRLASRTRRVRQLVIADPDGYLIRLSEFLSES